MIKIWLVLVQGVKVHSTLCSLRLNVIVVHYLVYGQFLVIKPCLDGDQFLVIEPFPTSNQISIVGPYLIGD
jgi:hypothetical protein